MKRSTKGRRKKWARRVAIITVLLLVFGGYTFTQLNFPYYTHKKLADLQARIGLHISGEKGSVKIIGHRGSGLENLEIESQREKELKPIGNTRTAIARALEARPHWIEIDLRRSKDGTLVLFHDEAINDKTDGEGRVSEQTEAQLQSCAISVSPSETILTLEEFEGEFLKDLKKKNIGLILDIKEKGLATSVLAWIAKAKKEERLELNRLIVFGEFETLKEYVGEGLRLGYTLTWKRKENRLLYLFRKNKIIKRLQELDANFLVVPVIFMSKSLVQRAESKGFDTWTYGSDDKRDWDRVSALGAKGLIVDFPANAVEHFYPNGDARTKTEAEDGARQPATALELKSD